MRDEAVPNELASAIRQLLDHTSTFTREEWAQVLGVAHESVNAWCENDAVPAAPVLRMIIDIVRQVGFVRELPLQRFLLLRERPLSEITPLAQVMDAQSLSHYLRPHPSRDMGPRLTALTPLQRRIALLFGSHMLTQ